MWMPLAFLALHRTLRHRARGSTASRPARASRCRCCRASTTASSSRPCSAVGALLLAAAGSERAAPRRVFAALAAGGALAAVVSALYARPVLARRTPASATGRSTKSRHAARAPSSYLAATPGNWLYGRTVGLARRRERRLFPGVIPLLLAIVGLLLRVPAPTRHRLPAAARRRVRDVARALRGYSYSFLYEHVPLYRGLRALARLGIFVADVPRRARGATATRRSRRAIARWSARALAAVCSQSAFSPSIARRSRWTAFPNTAPPVYRILAPPAARRRRGVPRAPRRTLCPAYDAELRLHVDVPLVSAGEWLQRDVSAVVPRAARSTERFSRRPGAIEQLRRDTVRYVIVHVFHYPPP